MKKAGMLTFHCTENYGALLQAYALQTALESLGLDVEILNYVPAQPHVKPLARFKHVVWNRCVRPLFSGPQRASRTRGFRNGYLHISKDAYTTGDALQRAEQRYDVFIAGSDQIWNPYLTGRDTAYVLDFTQKPKFAYAASFGCASLPRELMRAYQKPMQELKELSVREESGLSLVKQISGREAAWTLDPTLLMSRAHWNRLIVLPQQRDYILCYHMPGVSRIEQAMQTLVNDLHARKNKPILHIGNREYERLLPTKKMITDAGPREFLGWIKCADCIVTNSFHGVVFSIVFQKEFYVLLDDLQSPLRSKNTRVESLLSQLGLEERMVYLSTIQDVQWFQPEIDYQSAYTLLAKKKRASLAFLSRACRRCCEE